MFAVLFLTLAALAAGLGGIFWAVQMVANFKSSLETTIRRANDADYCAQNSNWKLQEYCGLITAYTFGVLGVAFLLVVCAFLSIKLLPLI